MQHVIEVLFPYLILLYACDCITYLGANQFLLTSWFGKKFQIKRSGFRLAGLLPTSQVIITHRPTFHCTPEGVYVASNQPTDGVGITSAGNFEFIAYEDLGRIEVEGKHIKINEIHTIRTPSSANATYQTDMITELKDSRRSARPDKIAAWLQASFDLKAIEQTRSPHTRAFSIITFLSAYLFLVVFLVLPAVLYTDLSKYANLDVLVICIALIYILLLATTVFTVRRSYRSDKDARIYTLLSIIFSPVNALHVIGYLTRNLYSKFHSLALAASFLPANAFKDFVRKELLLIEQYMDGIERKDWRELWKLKRKLAYDLLKVRNIYPDELFAAPVRQDQSALSYCPYCLTEYRKKRHSCIDCNMALKEFEADRQPMVSD